jgi:hypothetical protein
LRASVESTEADKDVVARVGRIDRSIGEPPCAFRCADILYGDSLHPHLRRIFESNLVPVGQVLTSDPFRAMSIQLLEAMEAEGWTVRFSKWEKGEEAPPRLIGVFELLPRERAR